MGYYTRLSKLQIESILEKFHIHNISSFELLSGGSENTNYLVKSENDKYVLCIYEQKSIEKAKELAELLEYLEENNFNTSKIIQSTNNESVISWNDKPIMIKKFIDGKIQKEISPRLLRLIGRELAKLHKIDAPEYLQKQLNYGKEQFVNVKKYAAGSEFDIWLDQILKYICPYLKLDLPKAFIHSDLFWNNVIISKDKSSAIIVDFEESAYYYRVFDIGMAIIGVCSEEETINLKKARYLLEGYQSEIKLLNTEINSLKAFTVYAGASMSFWRHQNFNYTKPDPKRFNHYLELKVLTDYISEQTNFI